MRTILLTLALLQASAPPPVGPVIQQDYPLIAQRPDYAGAVHVPETADFAACCSAFSASTTSLWQGLGKLPRIWRADVNVIWMATTPRDAVRVWVYSWRQAPDGTWFLADSVRTEPLTLTQTGAARPSSISLTAVAQGRTDHTYYVIETRGAPVIYGATLRVLYDLGASPRE